MTSRRGFLGALAALVVAPMAVLRGKPVEPGTEAWSRTYPNRILEFSSATGSNVLTTGGTTDLALDPDGMDEFYGRPYILDIDEMQLARNRVHYRDLVDLSHELHDQAWRDLSRLQNTKP